MSRIQVAIPQMTLKTGVVQTQLQFANIARVNQGKISGFPAKLSEDANTRECQSQKFQTIAPSKFLVAIS